MKPTNFRHSNMEAGKYQDEYQNLPSRKFPGKDGMVVCCWKMSFKERLKAVFTGRVWLSLLTFNKPLQPVYMSVNRNDMYSVQSQLTFKRRINNILRKTKNFLTIK